ncbi:sensor histidine kinase [Pedobacter sp. SYSU D00535]|uniref:sensor histidine kinase n=1 Tax=Pedobacter sp. SYSU D00535 TaxID=2810308 RepID=UPI001F60F342|nr:histidine kinase [Pedobacter sp. SYSU D00535]
MGLPLLSSTRVLTFLLTSWLIWIGLHAATLYWLGFSLEESALDAAASNVLFVLSSLIVSNTLRYYQPGRGKYFYIVVWCILLAALSVFLYRLLVINYFSANAVYLNIVEKTLVVRFCIGFLLISGMGLLSVLWYTQQDYKENQRRKADAERLAREAELYNLRQQLQPHFLFNSLNSISALIGRRPEEARTMIYQLSDFLRGTLRKEENEFVSLEEELRHLQLYLDIERVRFGHRLKTEISKEESCDALILPAMLLQPIVENAIKFGLYDTTGEVIITVTAACVQNYLVLTIKNPYDPHTARPKSGTGFGLSGIKRRLYLLFARTDLIETTGENNTFTTTVKIPQNDKGNIN